MTAKISELKTFHCWIFVFTVNRIIVLYCYKMAFCFKVIVCHFCRCLIVPWTYSFFFAVRNNFIVNVFIGFYSFVLLWYMQANIFYHKQNNSYMTVCCMRSLVRYTCSTLAINLVFPRTLVLFSMNCNFDNIYPVWLKIYFC